MSDDTVSEVASLLTTVDEKTALAEETGDATFQNQHKKVARAQAKQKARGLGIKSDASGQASAEKKPAAASISRGMRRPKLHLTGGLYSLSRYQGALSPNPKP